jgi:hypothetical protein
MEFIKGTFVNLAPLVSGENSWERKWICGWQGRSSCGRQNYMAVDDYKVTSTKFSWPTGMRKTCFIVSHCILGLWQSTDRSRNLVDENNVVDDWELPGGAQCLQFLYRWIFNF